jgi:GT2 family glycosyltransferase
VTRTFGGSSRVCLAISTFRNDSDVARILECVEGLVPDPFFRVIVVDSLGTGALPKLIKDRRWDWVDYRSSRTNLGSAGNLSRRLKIGAELGADYTYAVNHDGIVDLNAVRQLLMVAREQAGLGAVYPLRRFENRSGAYDVTGQRRLPIRRMVVNERPFERTFDVFWSSSNGALYSMRPVRDGLLPWSDLWMGWEDLGYGWLLHSHGYRQLMVSGACVDDNYEFVAPLSWALSSFSISDKPYWYSYYATRNLILVVRRQRRSWFDFLTLGRRIALDCCLTAALRDQKIRRLRLIGRGVLDGIRERTGMQVLPG